MYYKLGKLALQIEVVWFYKLGQVFLQIEPAITNQGNRFYKIGQLLQIETNVLQIGAGITNQGNYYKLGHNNEIIFDAPIRAHHVYKEIRTPQKDDILYCKNDYHSEALDKHAVGI